MFILFFCFSFGFNTEVCNLQSFIFQFLCIMLWQKEYCFQWNLFPGWILQQVVSVLVITITLTLTLTLTQSCNHTSEHLNNVCKLLFRVILLYCNIVTLKHIFPEELKSLEKLLDFAQWASNFERGEREIGGGGGGIADFPVELCNHIFKQYQQKVVFSMNLSQPWGYSHSWIVQIPIYGPLTM